MDKKRTGLIGKLFLAGACLIGSADLTSSVEADGKKPKGNPREVVEPLYRVDSNGKALPPRTKIVCERTNKEYKPAIHICAHKDENKNGFVDKGDRFYDFNKIVYRPDQHLLIVMDSLETGKGSLAGARVERLGTPYIVDYPTKEVNGKRSNRFEFKRDYEEVLRFQKVLQDNHQRLTFGSFRPGKGEYRASGYSKKSCIPQIREFTVKNE